MSAQVWKYPLKAAGENVLEMPYGAEVLAVQPQAGVLVMLWAEVNTTAPMVTRRFFVAMTGQDLPVGRKYVGTAQINWLVVHVFEDRL